MAQTNGKKILVADDSPIVVTMLSRILREQGYAVVTAADGVEAAQRAYGEMPDLILLDIFMPRMNGYQVCRLLKSDPQVQEIPIVILTAMDTGSAQFWSLETGADAFMTKGFQPPDLLATVGRLLGAERAAADRTEEVPGPEELLSKVSALMDRELYASTVERIELQTILRNLHDGIMTVDLQRQVSSANPALCQLLGVEEAAVVGQPVAAALGRPAGPDALELAEAALAGAEGAARETEIHGTAGSTPVDIRAAVLHDYLGKVVGAVCLIQDITRRKEVERLYQQLEASQTRLADDLAQASAYVRSLLPLPLTGGVAADWRFVPSAQLGGDSFGYHWIDEDHFAVYLLDVCGHGVGAALLSVSAMNVLRSQTLPGTDFRDPGAVLSMLNNMFQMAEHNNLYFTIWYGVYQRRQRRLLYASGGHPPAILFNGGEDVQRLGTKGAIIGWVPDVKYAAAACPVGENAKLYVFSDGAFEVSRPDGSMLKPEDFLAELGRPSEPGVSDLDRILLSIREYGGTDTLDDDFSMVRVVFNP